MEAENKDNSLDRQATPGDRCRKKEIHKACKLMRASVHVDDLTPAFPAVAELMKGNKYHHHRDTASFHSIHPLKVISSCCALAHSLVLSLSVFRRRENNSSVRRTQWKVKMLWSGCEVLWQPEVFADSVLKSTEKCLLVLTLHDRASCTSCTNFFACRSLH